ncbi:hypothetical protein HY990_04415 [Candidatus Micrarchaeota archaeon]|nr:hypothetical protein [Candidatus Micrarchaeota archaeon]
MSPTHRPPGSRPPMRSDPDTLRISSHPVALTSFRKALEQFYPYCDDATRVASSLRTDLGSGAITNEYATANLLLPDFLILLRKRLDALVPIVENDEIPARALEMQIVTEGLAALSGSIDSNNLLVATQRFPPSSGLSRSSLEHRSAAATSIVLTFHDSCGSVFRDNGLSLNPT